MRRIEWIILFIKVFLVLIFLGIILPLIIELMFSCLFMIDKKPPGGSSLYIFFNYGR